MENLVTLLFLVFSLELK